MHRINWARIVRGGLIAGVVINMRLVIAPRYYDGSWRGLLWALKRLDGRTLLSFVVPGLVIGLCLLWVYAAIRARYGPGPTTAIRAGLAVWLISDLPLLMRLAFPYDRRPFVMVAVDLVLCAVAALVGAFFYQDAAPVPAHVSG